MKKQYTKPIVTLIDADILSNVMAASGSGGASANYGGGEKGNQNSGGGGVTSTSDELEQGTKGSIFTWYDDEDDEYCY